MIIDTHAHLSLDNFDNDREEVLERARQAGVLGFIEVGFDIERSKKCIELAEKTEGMYASVGIHPHDADTATEKNLNLLKEMASSEKVVAWGEIGLDYFRNLSSQEKQREAFIEQIGFADECGLPIIIHCRDAHRDLKRIISEYENKFEGVIHSYSGDIEDAEFYIDRGFILGIGCPLTYPKNDLLKEVVKAVPLEKIILETDAPYLPPQAFRGKRNESSYLTYVVKEIANLKNVDIKTVEDITTNNAKILFGI